MRTEYLMTDANATGEGAVTAELQNTPDLEYGIVQAKITGTATVALKGRTRATMPWVSVQSFSASGGVRCTLFPFMIADVTAYTDGLVTVDLVY